MSSRRLLTVVLALAAAPLLVPASASSTGGCTITGTPGDDLLQGTNGNDVICGLGGDDDLRGRGGHDVLRGGAGDDSLYDTDDRDILLGGTGADWCNSGSRTRSCDVDTTFPVVDAITSEVDSVDVTEGPGTVVVRVAMTDETPLDASQYPTLYLYTYGDHGTGGLDPKTLHLESGTRAEGVWRARVQVPQGYPPSYVRGLVYVRDTGLNLTREWSDVLFDITDEMPDLEAPRVHLRSPRSGERIDLRGGAVLGIRARITDAGTGVAGRASLCFRAVAGPTTYCGPTRLVSGDRHDGVWAARIEPERGLPTGRYCIEVHLSDAVRSVSVACDAAKSEAEESFARGQSGEFRFVSR